MITDFQVWYLIGAVVLLFILYAWLLNKDDDDPLPKEGARVILRRDFDRYPHFIAPYGARGTVVEANKELIAVRMDEYLPGAEGWGNEVHVMVDDDKDQRIARAFWWAFKQERRPKQ